jgi:hypothetical protein
MSVLSERLAATKVKQSTPVMYSKLGAVWQEAALARATKYSAAWSAIGRLVTDINNNTMTALEAENEFKKLLAK